MTLTKMDVPQLIEKAARRRIGEDFRNSLIHTHNHFKRHRDFAWTFTTGVVAEPPSIIYKDPVFENLFESYFADRHAWNIKEKVLENKIDMLQSGPPLRVFSICVNAGILVTIRTMQHALGLPIKLSCNFSTPSQYFSDAAFLNGVDIFATEASVPARSETNFENKVRLLCSVHTIRQGLIATNHAPKNAFVIPHTSTQSHFQLLRSRLQGKRGQYPLN